MISRKGSVLGTLIQAQAKEMIDQLCANAFRVSDVWFRNFKNRHNINSGATNLCSLLKDMNQNPPLMTRLAYVVKGSDSELSKEKWKMTKFNFMHDSKHKFALNF
jgi:hypothetical protein